MDYVDFIVHVFSPEKRAFYGLERLRKSAKTISVAELNAEMKALITASRSKKAPAVAAAAPAVKKISAKKTVAKKAAPVKQAAKKAAKKTAKPAVKKTVAKKAVKKSK
jgi:ribosome-associated protein